MHLGMDGEDGNQGPKGEQGPKGFEGFRGLTGPPGLNGETGTQGTIFFIRCICGHAFIIFFRFAAINERLFCSLNNRISSIKHPSELTNFRN